ncbi:MAG: transposase [Candidatus Zixiibacteriota bacterium]
MKKIILSRRKNSLRLKHFDYSTPRAYFVTICSHEGKKVFSNKELAKTIIECLKENKAKTNFKIYIYCLMPDHLHILLNPADSNMTVSRFIQTFKSQTGFWYKKQYGTPLWQRGFYDHIIRKNESLIKIAQYILDNPVRKRLVEKAEQYPYSGLLDEIV